MLVLIGYARHAVHSARSTGMNACSRVADQLAAGDDRVLGGMVLKAAGFTV
mgnify:CR=1 FL=1